jgi:hypothetical protein
MMEHMMVAELSEPHRHDQLRMAGVLKTKETARPTSITSDLRRGLRALGSLPLGFVPCLRRFTRVAGRHDAAPPVRPPLQRQIAR